MTTNDQPVPDKSTPAPYLDKLQSMNMPPRGKRGSRESARRAEAAAQAIRDQISHHALLSDVDVSIIPAEASDLIEQVDMVILTLDRYALGAVVWDDVRYHAARLSQHLHQLLDYHCDVPEPPPAPPKHEAELETYEQAMALDPSVLIDDPPDDEVVDPRD